MRMYISREMGRLLQSVRVARGMVPGACPRARSTRFEIVPHQPYRHYRLRWHQVDTAQQAHTRCTRVRSCLIFRPSLFASPVFTVLFHLSPRLFAALRTSAQTDMNYSIC